MLDPGTIEVATSQAEKIGLPDWSSVKFMASAKTIVPEAEYEQAHGFLNMVLDIFIKERTEEFCKALNAWGGLPTQTLDPGSKQGVVPQGISIRQTEITISRIEQVGRPNKSMIDLFESVKGVADHGDELGTAERLWVQLEKLARQKRDVVIANPRPWTNAR